MTGSIANLPLVTKSGAKASADALKGKVVVLYFSASWCGPCRAFTPVLRKFYETLKANNQPIEIVFVSGDRNEADFKKYFDDHGDWLAVDFNCQERQSLGQKYDAKGIPSLLVVDGKGKCVMPNAREDVSRGDPVAAFAAWKKAAGDWRETAGTALGGSGAMKDAAAMRAARLAALGVQGSREDAQARTTALAQPAPTQQPEAELRPKPTTLTQPAPVQQMPVGMSLVGSSVDGAAIAQLMSMGFPEAQPIQVLESTSGNVEQAVAMLLGGQSHASVQPAPAQPAPVDIALADGAAIEQLTSMGFAEDQSRQVLESTGGNVDQALAILLG